MRALIPLLLVAVAALALSACGGSSAGGSASQLLRQTFSGPHRVNSGRLTFALTVQPSGSSTLTQPITLSFGGPFQSRGAGKLPESNFAVSVGAEGHSGSLSIISTGTTGYVSLSGASYKLPAADFRRLESSFSSIASSGSGGSGQKGTLSKLGINPLGWLVNPTVIGQQSIGGAATTHIRAAVDVPALLRDLDKFLQKASSLGVAAAGSIPTSLSAAEQQKIASEVRNPSFDVWTGNADKTVRQLIVGLSLPVSGALSTELGGMKAAGIKLTLRYSDLNQPQTIAAPSQVQPYSVFQQKLATLLQAVQAGLGSTGLGSSSGSGSGSGGTTGTSGGSSTTGGAAAGSTNAYSRCITAAGNDVSKMQSCASLLNSGG
jgi:hypothetical protein